MQQPPLVGFHSLPRTIRMRDQGNIRFRDSVYPVIVDSERVHGSHFDGPFRDVIVSLFALGDLFRAVFWFGPGRQPYRIRRKLPGVSHRVVGAH